ncbi:MAG TPA: hypothetical protein VHJ38_06205 [Nitrososphaeraceae archaeon]|nr:hypothetical protein [Nitrososphaeraceae archaeon]
MKHDGYICNHIHNQDIHDKKRGEQQKILHKGSNDKVNVFITLLYPLNRIKFNTSKTRNNNDFINHLKSIKRYVLREISTDLFL